MFGLAASFGLWWGIVLCAVAVLALLGQVRVHFAWLAGVILLNALYFAALIMGSEFIPLSTLLPQLEWNWAGKIAATISTLAALAVLMGLRLVRPGEAGLTLRQAPGSVAPALAATAVLTITGVGIEALLRDGTDTGLERLLYQASMPGLDEELFFRGLMLAAMSMALTSPRVRILGAPIGWAGFLIALLFGLGHGLVFEEGAGVHIAWLALGVTAYLGLGLLWIRERTGSVLIPIFSHNLINLALSFF